MGEMSHIGGEGCRSGVAQVFVEGGESDRRDDSDYEEDDHYFDEGESLSVARLRFHSAVVLLVGHSGAVDNSIP